LGVASLRGKIHAPFWIFQGLKSVLETLKNTWFIGAKARLSWLVTGFLCWKPDLKGLAKECGVLRIAESDSSVHMACEKNIFQCG
jgi:hypothetical protein